MIKSIVKASEPFDSNLHHMLRHRLSSFQPYARGRWTASIEFFTQPSHQARRGSKVWNRVAAAWKSMLPEVSFIEPQCFEEFLNSSFWWNSHVTVIGPGFLRARVGELHSCGLQRVRDVWDHTNVRFMTSEEVFDQFEVLPEEASAWTAAVAVFQNQWPGYLTGHAELLMEHEYVGLFADPGDNSLPICVVKYQAGLRVPIRDQSQVTLEVPLTSPLYTVKPRTRCLEKIETAQRTVTATLAPDGRCTSTTLSGYIRKVRVVGIERGQRKVKELLYYGRIDLLDFDPGLIKFHDDICFMSYTTKRGRDMLRRHHIIPDLARKWADILPDHHHFR